MSAVVNNDYQTNLLFKRFTGVAATQLDQEFSNEPYRAIYNIFSRDIMIEEIPDVAPFSIFTLDNSGSWADSSGATPSLNGTDSFATLYPDLHIEYYKNVELDAVPGSNSRVWYKLDASNNNILTDAINFKYDDATSTYLMRVKYWNGASYINNSLNSFPLFWVFANQSGYLQMYQTTTNLGSFANIPSNKPKISFYKYVGKKGLLNLDICGQQQVGDLSGSVNNIYKLNRMILPDGFVDISGTNYDLCGNEVVRTNYTYNRKNMFIGYENLPELDASAVDHSKDPSHNTANSGGSNVIYTFDVSGTSFFGGKLSQGTSFAGGTNSVAIGINNRSLSQGTFSSGIDCSSNSVYSFSHGIQTQSISGGGSHSEGFLTTTIGAHSHAEGQQTKALGVASHSEGKGDNILSNILNFENIASGDYSHTEGVYTKSIGEGSHAEGLFSESRGNYSHAEGNSSKTYGIYSHTEGWFTQSIGIASHSEGKDCSAIANYSHAEGLGTIIDHSGAHSTGHYNDISQNVIFVIGCGKSDISRMDAFYVDTSCITHINNRLEVSGDLELNCNNIFDVSSITFCDGTYLGPGNSFDISTSQILDIISNKTIIKNDVGIRETNPIETLHIGGSTFIEENIFISSEKTQSTHIKDKSIHARNTNLIDTLRLSFESIFDGIWVPMVKANTNGGYINFSTGQQYILSQPNPGKPNASPTFSSAWGPCVIPIAYLDINQDYQTTPFDPNGTHGSNRPHIANTCAYFTVKFSQLYDSQYNNPLPIPWDQVTDNVTNTGKSGLAAITHQTIKFVAGYTDNFKRNPGDDTRKPKPFIKILSTNIPNLKNLVGLTSDGINPIDINVSTNDGLLYGSTPTTPKIGGIVRIIIAESCPGIPADKEIRNKVWLLLEQQWNYEGWQGGIATNNSVFLRSLLQDHVLDVRMYSNNHGHIHNSRQNPFTNDFNTDWQLVMPKQILEFQEYSWDKFVLPMGTFANPPVFNTPTIVPFTDVSYTLMVGGTLCPNPLTGILDGVYPEIYPGANLWEVWLNLIDSPYGITTTEEVFENNAYFYANVDICGNIIVDGTIGPDITCNNLDALNSIDVGPNQKLTLIENSITSSVTATGWAPTIPGASATFNPGLELKADNFYFDCLSTDTTRGFIVSLAKANGDSIFRIVDNSNNSSISYGGYPLFQVEGSGLVQTKNIYPWTDMCYNIGISTSRYKNLFIGNIDTSGNVDIGGDLTVDGNVIIQDLSATNIDVSNNFNVFGDSTVVDLSATNIDVSNDLNVEGLITGVADTTFVEYRNYINDISFNVSDWYCIARTKDTNTTGGADNARGLFIVDDNTSGRRQQIIFYAGTSYSRGNYINVIANNWYGSTPTISNLKLETGTIYSGTNLYIYRESTTVADRVYVRLYQNTRIDNTGGRWELTATPIAGLTNTPVELDLTYNPNNDRANSVSSLDTLLYGDFIVKPPNNNSNNVIDVDREAIRVNFGGYDYTGGTNLIGNPTAQNRVIVDLQAGSTQYGLNVADSDSVIQTLGGIKILPLQSNSTGAPPNYAAPGWGSSLFLGEWGWGNQSWNNQTTVRLSQKTNDQNRPGSGNVYCNAVRQNIVYSALNNQGPTWNAGYQGFSSTSMYYNQGDIRYIIVDPRQGSNNYATVTLPAIQPPMLGQAITVARTMVPDNFNNYDAGLLVKPSTGDRINCPHSIFIDDNAFGGISIDPHNVMGNTPNPGFDLPTPYKGNEICSVTLVASQNGYYNTNSNGTSGGSQITSQFVWQFISSGSPGV